MAWSASSSFQMCSRSRSWGCYLQQQHAMTLTIQDSAIGTSLYPLGLSLYVRLRLSGCTNLKCQISTAWILNSDIIVSILLLCYWKLKNVRVNKMSSVWTVYHPPIASTTGRKWNCTFYHYEITIMHVRGWERFQCIICYCCSSYQINARTDLAITYNNISPLENHHCAVAFQILEQVRKNFPLKKLTTIFL